MLSKSLLAVAFAGAATAVTPTGFQPVSNADLIVAFGNTLAFVLSSANNETAFAPYFGPSPPNKAPNTHRYTQLLLDTSGTNNSVAIAQLKQAAATRTNFNAVNVVKAAGVPILAGNSFDVSNGTSSTSTNSTSTSGSSGTIPAAAPHHKGDSECAAAWRCSSYWDSSCCQLERNGNWSSHERDIPNAWNVRLRTKWWRRLCCRIHSTGCCFVFVVNIIMTSGTNIIFELNIPSNKC